MSAVWKPGQTPIIVRHRDGWCAIKPGVPLDEDAWKDYTLCDNEVACRTASDVGMPDCVECFERLEMLVGPDRPGPRLRASVLSA